MKIRLSNAIEATGRELTQGNSGMRAPLHYTRSETCAPNRTSEEQHVTDGMRGSRRTNRRVDPYTRPRPQNPGLHSAYPMNISVANSFMACKLFDQIKAMIPHEPARYGSPHLLPFEVDGQQYELRVFDGGTFMIDRLNPASMLHSLMIEPSGAIGGMTNFPGGQENLARFLASISARLQYLTS